MRFPALVLSLALTSPRSRRPRRRPASPPLFNGKDLTGLRGGDTFDHRKLLAMPEAERAAKIDGMDEDDARALERAEGGELVNDGKGAYATTEKDYGDFELLVEYKTVPLADSGIYLRGVPQVQIWDSRKRRSSRSARTKAPADSGTIRRARRARIRWSRPTSRSANGTSSAS